VFSNAKFAISSATRNENFVCIIDKMNLNKKEIKKLKNKQISKNIGLDILNSRVTFCTMYSCPSNMFISCPLIMIDKKTNNDPIPIISNRTDNNDKINNALSKNDDGHI
tara:strand:+ start:1995 stop:2321 length:327 start_codon:yes stop_codon:yes gene_type:complete